MVVELADGAEPPAAPAVVPRTIFDRITAPTASFPSTVASTFATSTTTATSHHSAPKNNREGLFGTAIVDSMEEDYEMQQEPRSTAASSTTFSVTLGSRVGTASAGGGGGAKYPGRAVVAVGGGGGGRAKASGGGGAFKARNGGGGGSNIGRTVGKTGGKGMDLDADLDAYMVKR